MKKWMMLSLTAVFAAGALIFSGCGKNDGEKRVLRMAVETSFPPYVSVKNGEVTGIDVDIAREIAQNIGCELEIVVMKFDSVILSVEKGKCDIAASGITVTEARKEQIAFSEPYHKGSQVVVVPQDSGIVHIDALKDAQVRIGVKQGTSGDAFVSKNLHEPERFENAELAVSALAAGTLDAVVYDGDPVKELLAEYNGKLKILPGALTEEEYAFGLNKNDAGLLRQFNAELEKMKQSGRLQEIIGKHVSR